MVRRLSLLAAVLSFFVLVGAAQAAPLTPGDTYTVTLSYLRSNGTLSAEVASTTAVADGDGKLSFSFEGAPDLSTCHFLLLTVKDGEGTTIRRALAPSSPEGGTTALGVSDLTETQTTALLTMAEAVGSDDPILMAYALTMVRAANMSLEDAQRMGQVGAQAILGAGGFADYLLEHGVSEAQLNLLREAIIDNDEVDLGNFTALFKEAVEAADSNTAQDYQGLAGGLVGDIFMAAAHEAGIDPDLIIAAHNAAGVVCNGMSEWDELDPAVKASINAAMSAFHMRMGLAKVRSEYVNALTVLGATGAQVTRFLTAVETLNETLSGIDRTYSKYFCDPAHNGMTQDIMEEMNGQYQAAFNQFQEDMQSSDDEIAALRVTVASAFGAQNPEDLGEGFGKTYNSQGEQVNIPIPAAVAMNWVADIVLAGGGLTYTRDTLEIPEMMSGWGFTERTDFTLWEGMPASGAALFGLEEDIHIIQCSRWQSNHDAGGRPSQTEEAEIRATFASRLAARTPALGGTTDGTTSVTTAQKEALVRMVTPPDF